MWLHVERPVGPRLPKDDKDTTMGVLQSLKEKTPILIKGHTYIPC